MVPNQTSPTFGRIFGGDCGGIAASAFVCVHKRAICGKSIRNEALFDGNGCVNYEIILVESTAIFIQVHVVHHVDRSMDFFLVVLVPLAVVVEPLATLG